MVATTLAIVALLALVGSVALRIHDQRQIDRIAQETHESLCAFKQDLEERVRSQEKFLRDIREGRRIPIDGITENDLELALAARRATLESLHDLTCPQ